MDDNVDPILGVTKSLLKVARILLAEHKEHTCYLLPTSVGDASLQGPVPGTATLD